MRKEIKKENQLYDFINVNKETLQNTFLVLLNCKETTTLKELYNRLKEAFNLPEYFGNNWNAFEECLQDLSWLKEKKVLVIVNNFDDMLKNYEFDLMYLKEEKFNFEDCLKSAVKFWHGNFNVIIQENTNIYQLLPDE